MGCIFIRPLYVNSINNLWPIRIAASMLISLHYHSSADVPANLDMEFLTSVTKMVLATILYEAKKGPSGQLSNK